MSGIYSSLAATLIDKVYGPVGGLYPGPGGGGPPTAWMNGARFGTLGAGTGNKDFTISGMGTPTAAIVIFSSNAIDSDCIGAMTATGQRWYVNNHSDFNATQINSETTINNNGVIRSKDGAAVEHVADFVSFITDGVRLNFTTNDDEFADATFIFFGGTACQAKAITHSIDGNAVNNTVDVTDVGFEPELVFSVSGNSGNTSLGSDGPGMNLSIGLTHNDGGADPQPQFGMAWACADDTASVSLRSQHRFDSGYAIVSEDGNGANLVAAELLDFDSSGFTVHCRERTNWGTTLAGALCVSWDGVAELELRSFDTPTSTGTQAHTSVGFQPTNLLGILCRSGDITDETVGTNDPDANGVAWGFSTTTGDDSIAMERHDDDNSGNAAPRSNQDTSSTGLILSSFNTILMSSDRIQASFDSYDVDGYTLDYANTDTGAARAAAMLAFRGTE